MFDSRGIVLVCLLLVGCDDSQDEFGPAPAPAPVPTTGQAVSDPEPAENTQSAPVREKDKPRKHLDLSLPPQPAVVPRKHPDAYRAPVLPDVFELEKKNEDGRSPRVKGEVLTEQGEEQRLDTVEGGKLIIEMKTR